VSVAMPSVQQVLDIVHAAYKPYYGEELPAGVGIAVGLVAQGWTLHAYLGNLSNFQGQPIPWDRHEPFQLASVTKSFTATLLAVCQAGDDSFWSNEVNAFHPPQAPPLPGNFKITLKDISSYVSGLPQDNVGGYDTYPAFLPYPYSVTGMYGFVSQADIPVNPQWQGKHYTYSNLGYSLLAHTIPLAMQSEQSFGRLLAENVLGPLKMTGTRWFNRVPYCDLTTAWLVKPPGGGNPVQAIQTSPGYEYDPAYYGSCGLVSTPEDMARWLRAHMGLDGLLPANVLQLMQTNLVKPDNYKSVGADLGVGWFVSPLYDGAGVNVLWKDGETDGCNSLIQFTQSSDPGSEPSELGAFLLTNSCPYSGDDYDPMYDAVDNLMAAVLGLDGTDRRPDAARRARTGRLPVPPVRTRPGRP
jgi:serine-type D-Ala-D-Ala carboxypeptidase/endopeptidase